MATDATGSPTSLGIPTYNVDADAPSGLGFNAAMTAIDPLIAARAAKPAGIVSGEVPVWNGTTWVRSSATNIGPTSLGSGTPDATKFLRGDGSWQVPVTGAQGTELAYQQVVTGATVAVATEALAQTLLTLPATSFDGAAVMLQFFCPRGNPSASTNASVLIVSLWEGATNLSRLAMAVNNVASQDLAVPIVGAFRFTPTAASHTYIIKANTLTGTWDLNAGAGGVATYPPMFARITKV